MAASNRSRISRLREFVDIQSASTVSDGYGGQTVTWSNLYSNVPATVIPVRGNEQEVQGRRTTIETFLVKFRYGLVVSTANRIVWGTRTLDIRSVQDREGDRRMLTLECELDIGPE